MLKTMKKPNASREGRGVPLQRQNPKNFCVCMAINKRLAVGLRLCAKLDYFYYAK